MKNKVYFMKGLGTPAKDKKWVVYESLHNVPANEDKRNAPLVRREYLGQQ